MAEAAFVAERPRLLGLAYRMLGSLSEAEDVVQDAWLAWQAADRERVRRPPAWLTTVVTRLALDRLRSARRRREAYVGPWLPEPVLTDDQPEPGEMAALADSLAIGFLALLESLQPLERVVLVLADVYGVPFAEIAEAVGRTPAACRQIASRARRRVRAERPPLSPRGEAAKVVGDLVAAVSAGDVPGVVRLLAEGAVLVSDGGPGRRAARRPVVGAERVARLLVNVARRLPPAARRRLATVNGQPGLVVEVGEPVLVAAFEVAGGRVRAVHLAAAPDKLGAVRAPAALR